MKAIRAAKIDAEGSEFEVPQGAQRVLQQMRPILLFEMNESLLLQAGSCFAAVKQLLCRHEYKLHTLLDDSLQPWKRMAVNETIDCVTIPEESEERNLHEMSGLMRRKRKEVMSRGSQ